MPYLSQEKACVSIKYMKKWHKILSMHSLFLSSLAVLETSNAFNSGRICWEVGPLQKQTDARVSSIKAYLWRGEEGVAGTRNRQVVVAASRELKRRGRECNSKGGGATPSSQQHKELPKRTANRGTP